MNPKLGLDNIPVVELEIYQTSITKSFEGDLINRLNLCTDRKIVWIVIFSPMTGEAALRALNLLDPQTGKVNVPGMEQPRTVYFAAIGPTTRDFLRVTFDFVVDVCAEKPCAMSIREGINKFLEGKICDI